MPEYVHFMNSQGHNLKVEPCGFIIHPDKGWLGASPDALVTDISCTQQKGIAEVKCPFSKRDITPQDACKDTNFYWDIPCLPTPVSPTPISPTLRPKSGVLPTHKKQLYVMF